MRNKNFFLIFLILSMLVLTSCQSETLSLTGTYEQKEIEWKGHNITLQAQPGFEAKPAIVIDKYIWYSLIQYDTTNNLVVDLYFSMPGRGNVVESSNMACMILNDVDMRDVESMTIKGSINLNTNSDRSTYHPAGMSIKLNDEAFYNYQAIGVDPEDDGLYSNQRGFYDLRIVQSGDSFYLVDPIGQFLGQPIDVDNKKQNLEICLNSAFNRKTSSNARFSIDSFNIKYLPKPVEPQNISEPKDDVVVVQEPIVDDDTKKFVGILGLGILSDIIITLAIASGAAFIYWWRKRK